MLGQFLIGFIKERKTNVDQVVLENAKDTLCRNVLIYGHCRYEDQGCAFNHDPNKGLGGGVDQ